MERLDCLFDCSNPKKQQALCGTGELPGNSLLQTGHHSEIAFSTSFRGTSKDYFAVNLQVISPQLTIEQSADCGLRTISSLVSRASSRFPTLYNCVDSLKQTELLESGTSINTDLKNVPSSSNRMQFESSQTHLKRFIMFDHSAGKERIFVHPALLQDLQGHSPDALTCLKALIQGEFSGMHKTTDPNASTFLEKVSPCEIENLLASSVPCFGSKLDPELAGYRETVASACAKLESMRNDRICNLVGMNERLETPVMFATTKAESSSHVSCTGGKEPLSAANSSSWHENTEDIDALLYSDDEVTSTGHFPDDFLGQASMWDSHSKKRKRTSPKCKEEAGATAFEEDLSEVGDSSEVSVVAPSPEFTTVCKTQNYVTLSEKQDCYLLKATRIDTCSKNINDDGQNILRGKSCRSMSSTKVRRQKIKHTVRTLRNIIPGGDCMDAAVVLDEAIQYLKLLQTKVQQLDANRQRKYTVGK